jgi:hypothetical protein
LNLNKTEQSIYNCYLKSLRKGKPFQPRKDFSNLPPNTSINLYKLKNFFSKFPHISWQEFFDAPTQLHPNEQTPPLQFFTTRAAIKAYTLYQKQLEDQSPEKQLPKIKESLYNIASFCLQHSIFLDQYTSYRISKMPIWLQHYKEHRVNIYSLMELTDFSELQTFEKDELQLWCPSLLTNLPAYKNRYYNSEQTQRYVKEGTKKIKDFIKSELTKVNSNLILNKQTH